MFADFPWVLDKRYMTFWPDNTMGMDFYRALERKDPLYNGDLHGVANRWDPMDGAYDDWAPATSQFEHPYRRTGTGIDYRYENAIGNPIPESRANLNLTALAKTSQMFSHTFSGSPLRKNTFARIWENPAYNNSDERQFWIGANPAVGDPDISTAQGAYDRVGKAWHDRPLGSPAEWLNAPVFHRHAYLGGLNENTHKVVSTRPGDEGVMTGVLNMPLILPAVQDNRILNRRMFNNNLDATGAMIFKREDSYYEDTTADEDVTRRLTPGVKTVTVAQNPRIRDAFVGQGSTTDSVVLTCAQAEMKAYHPTSSDRVASDTS